MQLTEWARAPETSGPPPIPLWTDVVSNTNPAYRVGLIPPAALADDLAAAGVTYSTGRGLGYRLNGATTDTYAVGEVIANIFAEAASNLSQFLTCDPAMQAIRLYEAALDRVGFGDRDARRDAERARLHALIESESAPLPFSFATLDQVQHSLSATGRSIAGTRRVRDEAVRRFRDVIPAPVRPPKADDSAAVLAFLLTLPPDTVIARPDLFEAAASAGLAVGPRNLYAAADALGWAVVRRKGYPFYRVA
jgi:hypothetical protein